MVAVSPELCVVHRCLWLFRQPAVVAIPPEPRTQVIVGHYGLAAGAKSIDVRAPLWSLDAGNPVARCGVHTHVPARH